VAVRSEVKVCNRFIAGIAGSDSTESVDVCFLCLSSVVYVTASAAI
jgi:hypothetical protein